MSSAACSTLICSGGGARTGKVRACQGAGPRNQVHGGSLPPSQETDGAWPVGSGCLRGGGGISCSNRITLPVMGQLVTRAEIQVRAYEWRFSVENHGSGWRSKFPSG